MRHTAVHALVATTLGIWLAASPAIGAPAEAPPPAKAESTTVTTAPEVLFRGDYKEASARDVILDIAKAAGMSAVIPSDLEGNVTAHLDDVPVMRALALVVGLTNADYRVMDDTIYIIKRTIVVRASAANGASGSSGSSGSSASAESEVERVAREIDEENAALDRAQRVRSAAPSQPARVETYISIQTSAPAYPSYPSYPPYGAYASRYGWPISGGVVYAPLGGVNRVHWNPSGITRIPGGHVIPTWHTRFPRF